MQVNPSAKQEQTPDNPRLNFACAYFILYVPLSPAHQPTSCCLCPPLHHRKDIEANRIITPESIFLVSNVFICFKTQYLPPLSSQYSHTEVLPQIPLEGEVPPLGVNPSLSPPHHHPIPPTLSLQPQPTHHPTTPPHRSSLNKARQGCSF